MTVKEAVDRLIEISKRTEISFVDKEAIAIVIEHLPAHLIKGTKPSIPPSK